MSIIYRFLKSKRIEMMGIIITVDGPSGAGKGTLCYALAEKLGFTLLDSGAIYRVTALAALKRHADLTDEEGLAELARHLDIQFIPKNGELNVLLGGMDVSHLIRTQEVAEAASKIAVFPKVRSILTMKSHLLNWRIIWMFNLYRRTVKCRFY